jgi:hypothetical protein
MFLELCLKNKILPNKKGTVAVINGKAANKRRK